MKRSDFTGIQVVFQREFMSYFTTPLAYVFLIIFLMVTGIATFYLGNFFAGNQADLRAFFGFHPWVFLFLMPALSMRLWSEERYQGTIELLMTLPIGLPALVLGKFLAAWVFAAVAIALTFPIWLTVNYLGEPDNGVILAAYIGSWLMAGSYIAVGGFFSAVSKNQVIAFILSFMVCMLMVAAGVGVVLDWVPESLRPFVGGLSFLQHFNAIRIGVLDIRDILYFVSLMLVWLFATGIMIELKKSN